MMKDDAPLPLELVLKAPKWVRLSSSLYWLSLVALAILSVLTRNQGLIFAWSIAFGAVLLAIIFCAFRPAGVILSEQALNIRGVLSDRLYLWEDIGNIYAPEIPGSYDWPGVVWLELNESNANLPTATVIDKRHREVRVWSNYGYNANDLAEIMRAFRDRSIANANQSK
ncbi:hypothetical protein [Litorimonas cladophorae]|uniref:hypothetical protein n=1 Tax=Litorimonas cladophorae TaxID=1220491 RepID=UPI0016726A49|nr:hypothetical protein [Litorimonas cladophorae]